jgi:hypothetical protein
MRTSRIVLYSLSHGMDMDIHTVQHLLQSCKLFLYLVSARRVE